MTLTEPPAAETTEISPAEFEPDVPPRVIGRLGSSAEGPTLICLGSVHGNEPAGTIGLERVVAELRRSGVVPRGELLALTGNRQALARGVRWVDEDLNRIWLRDTVEELRFAELASGSEAAELQELEIEIRQAIERAQNEIWILDLHTTSGEGPPFGVLDDTLPNREFAAIFGIPFVVGLEEELDGTVLSYYVAKGLRTFGLECGQHDDAASADRAEAAIWMALVGIGLLPEDGVPDLAGSRELLHRGTRQLPRVVEIRYRHAVEPRDEFRMLPGFLSFQRVAEGTLLARDRRGDVRAVHGGRLLMPLYQEQGNDGYFLVRTVRPIWLRLSAVLRHLRAERFLHWFPGVRRAAEGTDDFIVDQHIARWLAVEILHLLGFRRHGHQDDGTLLVSRRPNDE